MGPVPPLVSIARAIGYAAFFVWCVLVGLALSALSLLRLGRLAGRLRPAR